MSGYRMLSSAGKPGDPLCGSSSFVAFAFPTYRVESWGNEVLGPMMPSRVRSDFLHLPGD